jgi:hypothetical protein
VIIHIAIVSFFEKLKFSVFFWEKIFLDFSSILNMISSIFVLFGAFLICRIAAEIDPQKQQGLLVLWDVNAFHPYCNNETIS